MLMRKITIAYFLTFAVLLALGYFIFTYFFLQDFSLLEEKTVLKDLNGGMNLLKAEGHRVTNVLRDYSAWTQSCEYIKNSNDQYRKENLTYDVLDSLDINMIFFITADGKWHSGVYSEPGNVKLTQIPLRMRSFILAHTRKWLSLKHGEHIDGVVKVLSPPTILAVSPITNEKRTGNIFGYMFMGVQVTHDRMKKLSALMGMDFYLKPFVFNRCCIEHEYCVTRRGHDRIFASRPVYDIFNCPVLDLELATDRSIYRYGRMAINRFLLWYLGSSCLVFVVIVIILHFTLLKPLRKATEKLNNFLKINCPAHKDIHQLTGNVEPLPELIEMTEETAGLLKQIADANEKIIMQIPVGIVLMDKHTVIRDINKLALSLVGYKTPGDVLGKKFSDVFILDSEKDYYGLKNEGCFETTIKRKDGTVIPILKTVTKITLNNEECYLEGFLDLTSSKEASQKVQEYQDQLEHMVCELNLTNKNLRDEIQLHQVTQKSLVKAREQAEVCDRLKSAFLANISHEIRTPLNALLGFAELMMDENISVEERKHHFDVISRSSTTLLETLTEIMDLSRLESGEVHMHKDLIKVNLEMHDIYEQWMLKRKRDIDFIIILPRKSNHICIMGDHQWFFRIFDHLLDNAFKFTKEGKVEIGYTVVEDHKLKFFVRDTGIGISSEKQKSIFDMFTQEEAMLARHFGGVGLGLSITRKALELLEETIWVESSPGQGSTFYFTFSYTTLGQVQDSDSVSS